MATSSSSAAAQSAAQASSSSSSSYASVAAVCTPANLNPIYGIERARMVLKYAVEDFAPFVDNFSTPMRAQIQRGQSQGLLLSMPYVQQKNKVKTWIGIFFPPAFPQRSPQTALLLGPTQSITKGHPIVAPNGAVRMERLDCGAKPESLLNILVSMIEILDTDSPVCERDGSASTGGTLSTAANGSVLGVTAPSTPAMAMPTDGANDAFSSSSLTPDQQALHDVFVSDYFKLVDKYLGVRMETVQHSEALAVATEALQKEAELLRQEADLLAIQAQEQTQLQSAVEAYTGSTPNGRAPVPIDQLTALDVVEPENDLHAQALDVLATTNAYEDQLDFLEKCLARRAITSDVYLRYVNTIAREAFQCKFIYGKAMDKVQQGKTLANLTRKYKDKGLDEQVISSVLVANAYNPARADRALADMVA